MSKEFVYVVETDPLTTDGFRMYNVHKIDARVLVIDMHGDWRNAIIETYNVNLGDGQPGETPELHEVACTCIGFAMRRRAQLLHKHIAAAILFERWMLEHPEHEEVNYISVGVFRLHSQMPPEKLLFARTSRGV